MGKFLTVALMTAGGVIAGLLLAPKSGKETRDDIKKKVDEYWTKAEAGAKEAKKGATLVKGEISESAKAMKGIAKDAAEDAKRSLDRAKEEVASRAKIIQSDVQRTANEARKATK